MPDHTREILTLDVSPLAAKFLADTIVVLHFLFVCFVLFGAFLLLKWRRLIWIHVPCLIWAGLVEINGWVCPLTPLENNLRAKAGLQMYSGDFIMEYLMPVLYPPALTRSIQVAFGIFVIALNVAIYWYVFRKRRRR